jgi:hypothetical protein
MIPRLTLPQLWLGLAVVLPGLASLLAPMSTVDLAWQLRVGDGILAGEGVPLVDAFTFTVEGHPWVDQQWGAQVLLSIGWQTAGWTGLVLLRAVLISVAWGCLVLAIRWAAPGLGARLTAALALVAFVVAAPALALRPQLFGVLLLCLTLAVLSGRRLHPRLPWAMPFVLLAWANLHGSFVLGLLLVGLAWLHDMQVDRRRAWRLIPIGLASGAATLVNPFGFRVLEYAVSLSTNRELARRVTEWQPPSVTDPASLLFFGSLAGVIVLVGLVVRRGSWPRPVAIVTLALFAGLGLVAARGVAWWPAVAAVTIAGLVGPGRSPSLLEPSSPDRALVPRGSLVNTLLLGVLVLAGIALLPAWRGADRDLGLGAPRGLLTQAPPGVTRQLRETVRPGDRIWNPQPWGSWFELAVPVAPVAFDSRIEIFPPALWAEYDAVAAAQAGWPQLLDRWGVTIVVTSSEQAALHSALEASPDWRLAYADTDGALFVRSTRDRQLVTYTSNPEESRSVGLVASPILYRR